LYNWAISVTYMKKSNIGFIDVYNYCKDNNMKELAERCPLHEVLNDMIIKHLPDPLVSQKRRVPVIWHGDADSEVGEQMASCDPNGETALMVTKITRDPHAGEIATGRLFSGTLVRGQELHISGTSATDRIQQVGVFMGPERVEVEKIPAGNIAAVTGLKNAIVGSTATTLRDMYPFEMITHASEPVVTVAVEAKHMRDLPKLVEVLRQVSKEDPTLQVKIDEETGEHLLAGMGELHLEVVAHRIERDKGVEITTSEPIVAYRETVRGSAGPVEGKSPNRHNRFYIEVSPLEPELVDMIKSGEISMRMDKIERRDKLLEIGMNKDEAKSFSAISESNVFIDMTKGVQYLRETMELIIEGFEEATIAGPMSREPCQGLKLRLIDVKLHEDAVHRGPAQVIPAVRQAIQAAILMADVTLLEPFQKVFIQVPQDYMGGAISEIQGRRGAILNMTQEGDVTDIEAKTPVAELFGFAGDLRSATEGRALWSTEFAGFESLPKNLLPEIVSQIRTRKGLKPGIPKPSDFVSE
jgi:elongation factor 2